MRIPVELFINGQQVEFREPPEILYNYTQTDIQNPVLVRNGYTKTFSVDSTKRNDIIFRHFWRQDSLVTPGVDFDPSKKLPFILYVNNDVYDEGYCKLEDVVVTGEKKQYSLTLFSSIGSFFNNLKYNPENGNQLKLSDLLFTEDGGDDELDFNINSATVATAWQRLQGLPGSNAKYDIINFIPAYNGIPDAIDADKVLVDLTDTDLETATTEDGKTYDAYNGYALMELDKKLSEWEVNDLRSYLQRPAVSVKSVINACCDPRNNGGYTVNLDSDFFNSSNPDWEKAWVTLPPLNDIKFEPEDTNIGTVTLGSAEGNNYIFWYDVTVTDSPVPVNNIGIDISLSLTPSTEYARRDLFNSHITYKQSGKVYRYLSSMFVQLVGYDSAGTAVCASNAKNLTNIVDFNGTQYWGNEKVYTRDSDYGGTNAFESELNMPVDLVDGYWQYNSGEGKHHWSTGSLSLTLEGAENVKLIRLNIVRSCLVDTTFSSYSDQKGAYRTVLYFNELAKDSTNFIDLNHYSIDTPTLEADKLMTYTDGGIHTNSLITKKMLLNTSFSPCDFLLSYTKTFGLYYLKGTTGKTISILTRSNFYHNYVIDINGLVDRGDDIEIQPLALERNWYDFKNEVVNGSFAEQYEKTTDFSYGMKRIETGYDFNPEAENLYDGNVFKTAIQCIEKSPYYLAPESTGYPSYFGNRITYNLFNGQDTQEVTVSRPGKWVPVNSAMYYDCVSKMQFHSDDNKPEDGSLVMVYYNGFKRLRTTDGTAYRMYLTDDVPEMYSLNSGRNCWLYTKRNNHPSAYPIASIPQFGRYIPNTAGYVTRSLDFGQPRQVYLKDVIISPNTEGSTVYSRYWKSYIEDLYNVNTRMVTLRLLIKPIKQNGAFVTNDKPSPEWLRYFYHYDNSLWVINEIRDWDVSSFDTTEVQLIKVQDISDYTTSTPPSIPSYLKPVLDLRSNVSLISQTGGTVQITVDSNMSWTASTTDGTITPTTGTGNTYATGGTEYGLITLTVPKFYDQTLPDAPRTITVSASGAVSGFYDSVSFQQEKWHPGVSATPRCTFVQFTGGTFICDWMMENTADADFHVAPVSGWINQSDIFVIGMEASSRTSDHSVRQWIGIATNDSNDVKGACYQAGLVNPDTGATSPWYAYDSWYILQFPEEMVFDQVGDKAGTTSDATITIPDFAMSGTRIVAKPNWVNYSRTPIAFHILCQENDGYDRDGDMVLYHPEYGQVVIHIRQLGSVFLNPAHRAQGRRVGMGYAYPVDDGLSFTNNYSTMTMPIDDTGSGNTYWSATTNESWINLANASATGSGVLLVTVSENPNASARTGMVTIHSASADTSFMVHQSNWSGDNGNDIVEVTQLEYEELVAQSAITEGTIYVITDAPCFNPSDYTTSADFKTINYESIVGSGNILIPTGRTEVDVTQVLTAGTKIATIEVDDVPTDIYAPSGGSADLTNYWTSAQTESAITSSVTEATRYQVTSTTVHTIIALSQQAYNQMTAHSNTTLYIINS